MYLQTKKVVVIFIVMIITFLSIINSLYQETQNTIPQISVVSSEELSFKISFAQNITDGFSVTDNQQQQLARYGTSLYQISDSSSAQFSNIVNSSEMVVVVGDGFNQFLAKVIEANPEKQFVLIENSALFSFDNVYQINIDYMEIYDMINRVSNDNDKSLVIVSDEYSSLAKNQYYEHEIAANANVKLEIVSNTADVTALADAINNDLKNGFTHIYSLDPYNNSTIITTAAQYNDTINNQKQTAATSEVQSSEESEASSQEVMQASLATVEYLDLNHAEYLNDQSSVETIEYRYDIKDRITTLIDATINDKLKKGNIVVSIKN